MRWWNRLPGASPAGLLELIRSAPQGLLRLPDTLLASLARPDLASRLLAFAAGEPGPGPGLRDPDPDAEKAAGQL
jgi:hypothetical protein